MYGSCRIPGSPLTAVFMQRNLCGKHWAQLWDMVDYLDDMQQYYVIWKEVITRSTGKCFLEVMKTQLFSSSWMSKSTFYTVMSLEQVHVWDGVQEHFINTCCDLVFFTKPLLQFLLAYQDNQLELRFFFKCNLNATCDRVQKYFWYSSACTIITNTITWLQKTKKMNFSP